MTLDPAKVRAALALVKPGSPVGWWLESEAGRPVADAARRWVSQTEQGKRVWWCEAHNLFICVSQTRACRMVERLVIPIPGGE